MVQQSESEKHLAQVIGKIFSDEKFAHALESNPEEALKQVGVHLSADQKSTLAKSRSETFALPPAGEAAIPWTRPVVRVLTKGTRPVVQVAVRTILAAEKETK